MLTLDYLRQESAQSKHEDLERYLNSAPDLTCETEQPGCLSCYLFIASHGLRMLTPVDSKSATLRVTTAMP